MIDMLEEAPPKAGTSWSLLYRTEEFHARQTTFGGTGPTTLTASQDNVHASVEPSLYSPSPTQQFLSAYCHDGSGSHGSGSTSTHAHSYQQSSSGHMGC